MPKFSQSSLSKLNTCDINLQILFKEVVKDYDCTVVYGHREKEKQNKLFDEGKSKVRYPFSKHNSLPSRAADVAPYVNGGISWNLKQCYHFAGYVLGVWNILKREHKVEGTLRLGSDWDRDYDINDEEFIDVCHFEILY